MELQRGNKNERVEWATTCGGFRRIHLHPWGKQNKVSMDSRATPVGPQKAPVVSPSLRHRRMPLFLHAPGPTGPHHGPGSPLSSCNLSLSPFKVTYSYARTSTFLLRPRLVGKIFWPGPKNFGLLCSQSEHHPKIFGLQLCSHRIVLFEPTQGRNFAHAL